MPAERDGQLKATLIRSARDPAFARGAILSLHGFCDYFFHEHVARALETSGYRYYALDERRAGRSLMTGNIPHFFRSAEEPFTELTWAIETIRSEVRGPIVLLAHSTGCLTASLYGKRGALSREIACFVFNSPFLDFPVEGFLRKMLGPVAALGALFPTSLAPASLGSVYGRTLHASESGEWDYDLKRKPLAGFPIRTGWIRAILSAQREIQAGLGIDKPILIMRSDRSYPPHGALNREAHTSDAVLNVRHMAEYGPRLGTNVKIEVIPGAKHDVFLSREPARSLALQRTLEFISSESHSR